jgi:hypothetical protein
MKAVRALFWAVCLAILAVVAYPLYYPTLVSHLPASVSAYLPSPGHENVQVSVTPSSPTPALSSTPNTDPIVLQSPPPAVAPGPAAPVTPSRLPWSYADCTFAISTMTEDRHLDQQEAWAIAEGFDSRFPLSDEPVYVAWEMDWGTVLGEVTAMCNDNTVSVSPTQIEQAETWFQSAIADHQEDTAKNPGNASWNNTWILAYTRLLALYNDL